MGFHTLTNMYTRWTLPLVIRIVLMMIGVCTACTPSSSGPEVVRSDEGAAGSPASAPSGPAEVEPYAEPLAEEEEGEGSGHTVGALETYRYWAGQDPDEDMEVLNGEYWSSAHWSKEYTLYLELRFPRAEDFVMGRNFTRAEEWHALQDAPEWFDPTANYELWEGSLGSRYYLHPKKGHIYIFERQF